MKGTQTLVGVGVVVAAAVVVVAWRTMMEVLSEKEKEREEATLERGLCCHFSPALF